MAWLSTELYYYPGSAPCRSVLMLVREMGLEVDLKVVDLLKAENKRPWFLRMNPQHMVPTLSDQGFVIWESRAVMQYLCNKYCTEANQYLYPKEAEQRGTVDRLLFFDMGTLNYAIREYFKPRIYEGLAPDAEKENLLKQSLDYLDNLLSTEADGTPGPTYLAGEQLTIADFAVLASLSELDAMGYSYRCYGGVAKWAVRAKETVRCYDEVCEKGVQMTRDRVKQVEDEVRIKAEKERKLSAHKK